MDSLLGILFVLGSGWGAYYFYQKSVAEAKALGPDGSSSGKTQKVGWTKKKALGSGADEKTIENVGPAGIFSLIQVGPDLEDFDVEVKARHLIEDGPHQTLELEGESQRGPVTLHVASGRRSELSVSLKEIKLSHLSIGTDDLDKFSERSSGKFDYNGATYFYDGEGEATYYPNELEDSAEIFEYMDFATESGDQQLSIVRWGDGEIEVSYDVSLKKNQVTVLSVGDAT